MSLLSYEKNNSNYLSNVYESTFKNDYINSNTTSKQGQIEPPRPAEILHKDHNQNMSSSISMARTGYPIRKPESKNQSSDLIFSTNFNLGDVEKIPIADTVTSSFFQPPNQTEKIPNTKLIANKFMQSHVPNGDIIKNTMGHESVYKEEFRGHKFSKMPNRACSRHYWADSAKHLTDQKFLENTQYNTSHQESLYCHENIKNNGAIHSKFRVGERLFGHPTFRRTARRSGGQPDSENQLSNPVEIRSQSPQIRQFSSNRRPRP